jgi:tripartite-type tricarboxylate transporter receptor subunit TctC
MGPSEIGARDVAALRQDQPGQSAAGQHSGLPGQQLPLQRPERNAFGAKRDPAAPELPTMAEAGVPGYEVSSWHGLFVPAKTPPEIVRKMGVDSVAALADPVVKGKLEQAGYMVVGSSPGELQTLLKSEIDKWSAVIKTVGIKIN